MSYVSINNLDIVYGKFKAVDNLKLSIPKGEVFGFIGPNGAGKTSTIKVLATLLKPRKGDVSIGGINVLKHPAKVKADIGYMPDFLGVYDNLAVVEYLHFFAAAYKIKYSERKVIVGDVLELTDLKEKEQTQVNSLSRGMKQRLGIARVLLHDPKLLLLDEPASGLDPRARIEMRELLKELKSMGKTILISSHILSELEQLCSCIGILEAGKLVAEGSLREIYKQLDLSRNIHLEITNYDKEMEQKLKKIEGVKSLEQQIDRLSVNIYEDKISLESFLEHIISLGARVKMFQPKAMDLETVFMKLTEGKVA